MFDTPIFDIIFYKQCSVDIESFDISQRFKRTNAFRDYLNQTWDASGINAPYFNWKTLMDAGEETFHSVERYIQGTKFSNKSSSRQIRR